MGILLLLSHEDVRWARILLIMEWPNKYYVQLLLLLLLFLVNKYVQLLMPPSLQLLKPDDSKNISHFCKRYKIAKE